MERPVRWLAGSSGEDTVVDSVVPGTGRLVTRQKMEVRGRHVVDPQRPTPLANTPEKHLDERTDGGVASNIPMMPAEKLFTSISGSHLDTTACRLVREQR